MNPRTADRRAWFGPAGTVTPVHYDHHAGLLVQAVGRKRVLLWPPSARELLHAPPAGSPLDNTSPYDPEPPRDDEGGGGDGGVPPEDAAALRACCECVELAPGDALLIPQGWWHYARSLSVSFSVSFWW